MKNNIIEHPLYEKLLKEFHPTKNGNLKLSDFSYGSHVKVWWKCYGTKFNDHEWEATIEKRFNGRGCPCCVGQKIVLSNCLMTINPMLASQLHPTKNGNLTAYDVTVCSGKKVWWFCTDTDATDHEWEAAICDRINGRGCPCCEGQKVVLSNCLCVVNSEIAKTWHPTLNGNLTPFDITACSGEKIYWLCEKGHEWKTSVANRTTRGDGCPICNESHGEKAVVNFLNKTLIIHERQKKYNKCKNKKPLPFDFYLPNENILIEYDGIQHSNIREFFGGEEALIYTKQNDSIKTKFAKDNNIPLLRIPYTEFNNIEALIKSFIYSNQTSSQKRF